MSPIRSIVIVVCSVVLASVVSVSEAGAEGAKVSKQAKKLDAKGELLVKLAGAELPAGLDAKAHAALNAVAAKLAKNDVDGALADWKAFVTAHGKKLGKSGIGQAGRWLVKTGVLELESDLADPADRVRFAREAKARAQAGIGKLSLAKADADKSKKPVAVKLVKLAAYQKGKPATIDLDASLTSVELASEIDKLKASIDSMSEMGEMESLRLQMAMDRLSKMMSTLSNILKKISDTADQITQNMK